MRLIVPVLLAWCAVPVLSQAAKYEKADSEAIKAVQEAWVEAAKKAVAGKHEILRMRAIDEARAAGVGAEGLRDEEWALMAPRNYAPLKDGPEAAGILEAARKAAGAAALPMLALDPPGAHLARHCEHVSRVLEADPKNAKALALWQKRTAAAASGKDWPLLRILVMRAAELDPEGYKAGKYTAAERALAGNAGIVVRGRDHLMQAYVVLPEGWNARKKWTPFVAIVGANCAYESGLKDLVPKAAHKPYILIVPMTIGNANEIPAAKIPYPSTVLDRYADMQRRPQRLEWDEAGLVSVLAEIRARYAGEDRFFLTGYSGGAFLLHFWLQHRADELVGACSGSGNYWEWCEQAARTPSDGGCPVLLVSGSKDQAGPPRIFPQSDQAEKRYKALGFAQVERRHLDGRDHEPFYELGLELLDKTLAKKK